MCWYWYGAIGRRLCGSLLGLVCSCYYAHVFAEPGGQFSAVLSASSNYFYRGYSKSANNPTVRLNLDFEHTSGVFLGSWLSLVDFDDHSYKDNSDLEIYPYVGFDYSFSPDWKVDTTVARYVFDGSIYGRYSDYNEYSLALSFKDLLTAKLDFADSIYHRKKSAVNYELSGRYPLTEQIDVSIGLGYYDAVPALDYSQWYWNAGFTWYAHKYVSLDFRYVDYNWTAESDRVDVIDLPYIENKFLFSVNLGI